MIITESMLDLKYAVPSIVYLFEIFDHEQRTQPLPPPNEHQAKEAVRLAKQAFTKSKLRGIECERFSWLDYAEEAIDDCDEYRNEKGLIDVCPEIVRRAQIYAYLALVANDRESLLQAREDASERFATTMESDLA